MKDNEKPASTFKQTAQVIGSAVGHTITDSARLAVKVAFITFVALSTVGALKKMVV